MTPIVNGTGRALDHLQQLTTGASRFAGRLDLTRVGVFGHSFGGAQASPFCSQDERGKARHQHRRPSVRQCHPNRLSLPFMFLLSDHGAAEDEVSREIVSEIQAIYDRQPRDTRRRMFIRGAHHFSDDGTLLKESVFRGCSACSAASRSTAADRCR